MTHNRILIHLAGSALCAAMLVTASAAPAEAAWPWHRRGPWSHSEVVFVPPYGTIHLRFGDGTYYFYRGRYYRHCDRGYVVIPPPVGAVVPLLPDGHRTIVIDGVTYHEYDGVYYKGGPAGYTVVPIGEVASPAAMVPVAGQPAAAPALGQPAAPAAGTTVVNIPNKNGSFTPVALQLAGNGMYIGPQGEIYPNLPTTGQLQAMYGK